MVALQTPVEEPSPLDFVATAVAVVVVAAAVPAQYTRTTSEEVSSSLPWKGGKKQTFKDVGSRTYFQQHVIEVHA